MMNRIKSPLNDQAKKVAGEILQEALVDLIDLTLQAKHAHWNLVGRNFRSLHLQLDEMVDAYRQQSDAVAERRVTIGIPADGQARTVANQTGLEPLPAEWLDDSDVVRYFTERLQGVCSRMRSRLEKVGEVDPVTEDLLIGITNTLEEQAWMIQAQAK